MSLRIRTALLGTALWVALSACGGSPDPRPPLLAEEIDVYLRVAPTIRRERRAGRAAGEAPRAWVERPGFRAALETAGWTLEDYLRIEGQIAAARLRIEDPELFAREFLPSDAPRAHVRLVEPVLDQVREAQAPLPAP